MKKIKEYFIPATLIIVLCIYLWHDNLDNTNYELPHPDVIIEKNISKIEISKRDINIIIKKINNNWLLEPEGYLADIDKVNSMIDIIANLSLTTLVSESKSYDRYGLGDDMEIIVKVFNEKNNKIREFKVGKAVSLCKNTFLKIDNDYRVYHAKGDFRSKFDNTVDELRDTNVLSFNTKEIDEIHINNKKQPLELIKKQIPDDVKYDKTDESIKQTGIQKTKDIWQTKENAKGNDDKINTLLFTLSALKCDGYLSKHKKEDFKEPIFSILLKNKKEYRLSIFAKINDEDKKYPAITSENDYPFYLTEYQTKKIMLTPQYLIKKDNET